MQHFQEEIFQKFREEIFLWLKILLAVTLLVSWFLFWRIYENKNFSVFWTNQNDWFTFMEISEISEKWIEWKVNFWSLKIKKDWRNFSYWTWKFFIEK